MPPSVFVGTSAWLAVLDRGEARHTQAAETYAALLKGGARLVTTDLVLAETHILTRRRLGHPLAMAFLDGVTASLRVEIVFVDADLLADAVDLLRRYTDQPFSLADAASFALMRQRGMTAAFAFDRHFVIAGFDVLPQTQT